MWRKKTHVLFHLATSPSSYTAWRAAKTTLTTSATSSDTKETCGQPIPTEAKSNLSVPCKPSLPMVCLRAKLSEGHATCSQTGKLSVKCKNNPSLTVTGTATRLKIKWQLKTLGAAILLNLLWVAQHRVLLCSVAPKSETLRSRMCRSLVHRKRRQL